MEEEVGMKTGTAAQGRPDCVGYDRTVQNIDWATAAIVGEQRHLRFGRRIQPVDPLRTRVGRVADNSIKLVEVICGVRPKKLALVIVAQAAPRRRRGR